MIEQGTPQLGSDASCTCGRALWFMRPPPESRMWGRWEHVNDRTEACAEWLARLPVMD